MEYFMSHIIYIVIAAILIAVVGFAAVVFAEMNQKSRDESDEEVVASCSGACNECTSFSFCSKPEKDSKPNVNKLS